MPVGEAVRVAAFGDADVLVHVAEHEAVAAPGPTEVCIDVRAAHVNPVDTYIRSGKYARLPELPYTPGKDVAGVVSAVGSAVTTLAVGDRVYSAAGQGTYASACLAEAEAVLRAPPGLSHAQASVLGVPFHTAYRAVFVKADARAGETLLVHGASGSVGLAAVALASRRGVRVVGTASSEAGRALVLEAGAFAAFGHDDAEALAAAAPPGGYDAAVTSLASSTLPLDLRLLRVGGRLAIYGNRGEVTINARDIMAKELVVRGAMLAKTRPEERREAAAAIFALCTGPDAYAPEVATVLPMSEAARAHREVIEHPGGAAGAIVLVPAGAARAAAAGEL